MKKTLLSVALAFVGTFAFAQKPTAGSKTAEVVLNFQTGTSAISYNLPGELRLRYFIADDMAVRVRLGLGSTSSTDKVSNTTGTTTAEIKTNSGFNLMLAPGIEKHFEGTSKLSPFVGAQLLINYSTAATTEVSNAGSSAVSAATVNSGDSYKKDNGTKLGLGLGLIMGADYYITDGIFVGGEMGLGLFNMTSNGDGTENSTLGGVKATEKKTLGGSTFDMFGVTTGGVRLGYRF
ncbi:MAG: hypothetical protein NTU43_12775 [Bacteroidetes bacterium]|nr:hypothetical protein [Bacteroidota bacterium]